MVCKKSSYLLSNFCLTEWIYPDNYLCLLCNIYVINQVSLISCSPELIYCYYYYYYLGLRRRSQTLYWVQREFDYCCCLEVLLGLPSPDQPFNFGSKIFSRRFFGLFGVYYSLQYLSLSDAIVLTFLAPMCTAMAGALFLGENFPRREAFAGRK